MKFRGEPFKSITLASIVLISITLYQSIITAPAMPSNILFYDGFEDGTFAKWTGTEPYTKGPNFPSWSVVSTTAYNGTYSAQMKSTKDLQWGGYYVDVPFEATGSREAYWRVYVKFGEFPVEGYDHTILWILEKGPPPWADRIPCGDHLGAGIRVKSGQTYLYVRRYHPDKIYYSVPYNFQRNVWYSFELSVRRATDGWYKVWINGELVFSELLDNSMAPVLGAVTIVSSAVKYQSYPAYQWYDECVASNSYIGPGLPKPTPKGTLTVDSTPISAECFVNGTSWGVTPQTRNVTVGTYTVTWANVNGYYTPAPRTVYVGENQTVTVIGEYQVIPPPPKSYKLSVWSQPVQGIPVQISNSTHTFTIKTGDFIYLKEGFYSVTVANNVIITFQTWTFQAWSDGLTNPTRQINLVEDTMLLYNYAKA